MTLSNLPPGIRECDIPGNRRIDEIADALEFNEEEDRIYERDCE